METDDTAHNLITMAFVRINQTELDRLIRVDGARYIAQACEEVLNTAKTLAPYQSGDLNRSGDTRGPEVSGKKVTGQVVFTARHAYWVNTGTGIHGPHHQRIYPTNASVLAWPSGNPTHFARSTQGMRPNPFLVEATELELVPAGFRVTIIRQ